MRSPRSNSATFGLGTLVLKKESHPKVVKKEVKKVRTPNLLVIIVVRKEILLMCAGARIQIKMLSQRAWFFVTSEKSKVIRHMNAERGP